MREIITAAAMLVAASSFACTNLIVGKRASTDGSVLTTYSADSYGAYHELYYRPAGKHAKGDMRQLFDYDTNAPHGAIPEAPETYTVAGYINEHQVTLGETTFGGREEMVDTTGQMDYGTLMYIALERSKTAREALTVMTTLAETYGYCSEGETFTIADPNEVWIMEMMGARDTDKAKGMKVVWVALRLPDDAICGHANQSRITRFNMKDKQNVRYSKNVVKYARANGWFSGKDADFSFRDAYAAPDFSGRRICEARVWSFFNRFCKGMDRYLPFVAGKAKEWEEMPLWVVPDRKVSLQDVQAAMRDHFEGTPFALDSDIGGGIWEMPYRPTPLTFKTDDKEYFNERPISTQQASMVYVSQMRSWLPDAIGGILWYANDDGNMCPFTPIYCCTKRAPEPYAAPGADDVTFSDRSAFWICNWVSNMVYPRYSMLFPSLQAVRDSLDQSYAALQAKTEAEARKLLEAEGQDRAADYLTAYSCQKADEMLARWKQLATYIIVKYNDMVVKPEKDGHFLRTKHGLGQTVVRPGYSDAYKRKLIEQTGDKLLVP